jgi:hypothetical protein
VVTYIIYREIMHNLGYFLWSTSFFSTIFGYVVVESHLTCIMKQTSFHNCSLFKMSLVLLLSSVVLPLVNGVTSCKLFHKKNKWHNWSKLYYSWIKLTLITMYKSSFLYIKWNKTQLWKLVCFIIQLKWNSATTCPNIVEKIVLQRKYPTL